MEVYNRPMVALMASVLVIIFAAMTTKAVAHLLLQMKFGKQHRRTIKEIDRTAWAFVVTSFAVIALMYAGFVVAAGARAGWGA